MKSPRALPPLHTVLFFSLPSNVAHMQKYLYVDRNKVHTHCSTSQPCRRPDSPPGSTWCHGGNCILCGIVLLSTGQGWCGAAVKGEYLWIRLPGFKSRLLSLPRL